MHNICDVWSKSKGENLNLEHNCKLNVKDANFKLINQHMNATCYMQEKDFYFDTSSF
jgi:hypothetical protein